jgi:hypothetical protein
MTPSNPVRIVEPLDENGALRISGSGSGGTTDVSALATSAKQDVSNAVLGATGDAAVDTDTTGTASGKLRGLVKLIANLLSRWPAALQTNGGLKVEGVAGGVAQPVSFTQGALAAGEAHVGEVGGRTVVAAGAVTRPADTAQYAPGDVIENSTSAPTVITFANCARLNAGSGVIIGAQVTDGANQTIKATLELWLFDTTVTPDNDNAVFTPTGAELLTLIGIIQFPAFFIGDATAGAGGNCVSPALLANPLTFKCAAAAAALYGVLVVRNAYVPVASEAFSVRLRILQD